MLLIMLLLITTLPFTTVSTSANIGYLSTTGDDTESCAFSISECDKQGIYTVHESDGTQTFDLGDSDECKISFDENNNCLGTLFVEEYKHSGHDKQHFQCNHFGDEPPSCGGCGAYGMEYKSKTGEGSCADFIKYKTVKICNCGVLVMSKCTDLLEQIHHYAHVRSCSVSEIIDSGDSQLQSVSDSDHDSDSSDSTDNAVVNVEDTSDNTLETMDTKNSTYLLVVSVVCIVVGVFVCVCMAFIFGCFGTKIKGKFGKNVHVRIDNDNDNKCEETEDEVEETNVNTVIN